ncbi:hypothetical protein ACSSZE_00030 [Acidithiobacillus caldus]
MTSDQSSHFLTLREAHDKLAKIYLRDREEPELPTPEDQELARAFVVFIHAELEHYFESISSEIADDILKRSLSGIYDEATTGIIAFSGLEKRNAGECLIDGKAKARKVSDRVGDGVTALKKKIYNNNGISQKYLASLFVPLGLTNVSV